MNHNAIYSRSVFLGLAVAFACGVAGQDATAQVCQDGTSATELNGVFVCGDGRVEASDGRHVSRYPLPFGSTSLPLGDQNTTFTRDFNEALGTIGGVPGAADQFIVDDGISDVISIFDGAAGTRAELDGGASGAPGDHALFVGNNGSGIVGLQVQLDNVRLASSLVQNGVDNDGDPYFEFDLDLSQISVDFDISFVDAAPTDTNEFTVRVETGDFDFANIDVFDPLTPGPTEGIRSFTIRDSSSTTSGSSSVAADRNGDGDSTDPEDAIVMFENTGSAYESHTFELSEGGRSSFFFGSQTPPHGVSSIFPPQVLFIIESGSGDVLIDNVSITGVDVYDVADVDLDGAVTSDDVQDVYDAINNFSFLEANEPGANRFLLVDTYNLTPTDGDLTIDDAIFLVEDLFGSEFGDLDLDGVKDASDRSVLVANIGNAGGYADGDLDNDGDVDNDDLAIFDAAPGLPGDADGDGDVDGDDLIAVQTEFGATGPTPLLGDGDFDGDVDGDDLIAVQTNFGAVASVAVPEPASLGLAALASLGLLAGRRGARG